MSGNLKLAMTLNPMRQILKDKGLTANGSVQTFHTNNVLRRIVRYMPYRSGATIKLTILGTDIKRPFIVTDAPYGQYLYHGKVMVGPPPKKKTDRTLNYTKTKNPNAGPFWDRALRANEGAALRADLQRYINLRG